MILLPVMVSHMYKVVTTVLIYIHWISFVQYLCRVSTQLCNNYESVGRPHQQEVRQC